MPEYKVSFTVRLPSIPLETLVLLMQDALHRSGFEESAVRSLRVTGPWPAPASYPTTKKGD